MENTLRPIVIGFSGPIGSGKTSVAVAVGKALECSVVSFGAYVRRVAIQSGQEDSRESLQKISEQLLAEFGPSGLTRKVLALWDRCHSLVVDGVRHNDVVEALKAEVAPVPFLLIYLSVSPEVRRQRLSSRDNLSVSQFEIFDQHSTEQDVKTHLKSKADIILTVDRKLEDTVAFALDKIRPHLEG